MNYYNEIDKKAAAWLRELILENLIPKGDVDERSIVDVSADDVRGYTGVHFFAGIGGWPYALRLAGWPDDRPVWTGSCPCQPFSIAGKGKGTADERHLWPEMRRLVDQCKPAIVFGEQVASAAGRDWFAGVRADLEALGYAVGGADLCAAGVGSPHIRQRLYWCGVGNTDLSGCGEQCGSGAVAPGKFGVELRGDVDRMGYSTGRESDGRKFGNMAETERYGGCGNNAIDVASHIDGVADTNSERQNREPILLFGRGSQRENSKIARGCDHGGVADATDSNGRSGIGRTQETVGEDGFGWWRPASCGVIYCRDGKYRRVPVEPLLSGVVDGLPAIVDRMRPESGFPICKKGEIDGRVMLLKGLGNAIVPQVAAAFISSIMDVTNER